MQTANLTAGRRRDLRDLADIPLLLGFLSADAVRFIPVQLRSSDSSAAQSHNGNAFHLPPMPPAVQPAKPMPISDTWAFRDRRDVGDLADDLETHWPRLGLRVDVGATDR